MEYYPVVQEKISHYRILELIVKNSVEVYLAEDTRFGRNVVLKILSEVSERAHARKVFKRQAMVAAVTDHPNIRSVYGVDEY
jgi:hypothetical protein